MSPQAARGESPAAFDRRRIPPRGVAPRSYRPTILLRCALPGVPRPARDALSLSTGGRLTGLGATRDFHHGLLVSCNSGSRTDSRAGHPAWQRCSSVTNAKFAPSLRLASSGAAPGTLSTNYCYRTLAQPALNSWSIFLFLLMPHVHGRNLAGERPTGRAGQRSAEPVPHGGELLQDARRSDVGCHQRGRYRPGRNVDLGRRALWREQLRRVQSTSRPQLRRNRADGQEFWRRHLPVSPRLPRGCRWQCVGN